jgi:hypothetical protein
LDGDATTGLNVAAIIEAQAQSFCDVVIIRGRVCGFCATLGLDAPIEIR